MPNKELLVNLRIWAHLVQRGVDADPDVAEAHVHADGGGNGWASVLLADGTWHVVGDGGVLDETPF